MRNRNPARGAARGFALCIAALLLGACASTTVVREEPAPSPIYTDARPSRAAAPPARRGPSHVVQAGDTLYGIAFRNSLDWREVARWNDIGEPYVIQPGQVLRLSPPRPTATRPAASRPPAAPAAPVVASGPPPMPRGPAGASGPVTAPPASAPASRPAATLPPGPSSPSAPVAATPPTAGPAPSPSATSPRPAARR